MAACAACPRCRREGLPLESGARPGAPSGFFLAPPSESQERVVSRSMLIPIPGMQASPPAEMICRLEPASLRWLDVSESLGLFLGKSIDVLVNQSFTMYVHQDDRELAQHELRQACELGERHDLVLRLHSRSGQWHYMRISTQARYELDGRLNHIRCNLRDVTDRVRAEHELRRRTDQLLAANEQLRQTNLELKKTQDQLIHTEKLASLGTLTAGIAHEINNPLAFALNNVTALERDVGQLFRVLGLYRQGESELNGVLPELGAVIAQVSAEIDLEYLEQCLPQLLRSTHRGLIRVAQIVEKLREFARLDRAEVGEVDVNDSVEQCLMMLSDTLARQQIKVDLALGELPRIQAAAADLNQVFLDLVSNSASAIESAGRAAGRITITTSSVPLEISVEICDNGCGISPLDLKKIFDPFFTTKPLGQGTGLGLSVSHGIVAAHGGRIEVTSQLGEGSCFCVFLPTGGPGP
jgi:two-component system, NtrC family, sensor kinase